MKIKKNIKLIWSLAIALVVTTAISLGIMLNVSKTEAHATSGITSLDVVLVWSDNVEPHMGHSASVTISGSNGWSETVTLSIGNCWQHKWYNLDPNVNYEVSEWDNVDGYYTQYYWEVPDVLTIEKIQNGSPVPPWPTPEPTPGEETWEDIWIPIPGSDTPSNGGGGGGSATQNETKTENNDQKTVIDNTTTNTPKIKDDSSSKEDVDYGPIFSFIGNIAIVLLIVFGIAALFIVELVSHKKNNRK